MGLDNGFVVRGLKRSDIPSFVKLPFAWDRSEDRIEIAYYRKCWGLRDTILNVIHGRDSDYTIVEAEDFPAIIRAILPFFKEDFWENEGDSIWTFEEAFENTLLQNTINLSWLGEYMKDHPEVSCYFYDSY